MFSKKERQELDEILKKYPPDRKLSAILPALYLAQRDKNWLDDDDIAAVAEALEIPVTHAHAIVGFYTLFRKERVGKYMVQVCTDLPCALRGADDFYKAACQRLGVGPRGGTTEDGLFTIEEVVCIAACDRAPVLQLNLEFHEDLTDEAFDDLISRLREAEDNEQGSTAAG